MNRTQEFKSSVGQAIQAENVTQIHHDQGRPLTTKERAELNQVVNQLADEFGVPGWQTWRFLHQTIGVENVEGMCLGHKDSAWAILELLLELATLKKARTPGSDAVKLADLQEEVVSLSKRLKDQQSKRAALERRLVEQESVSRDWYAQCESAQAAAARSETRAVNAAGRLRDLESRLPAVRQRLKRLRVLAAVLGVLSLSGAGVAYGQWKRAQAAEWRLTICGFEGKGYAVGSVLDGNPPRECVRTAEGRMEWVPAPKQKKGR